MSTDTASPEDGPPDRVVMLIRHGEKPLHPGRPHGVATDGTRDSHSLTVPGWIRAGGLVGLFAPTHGQPPAPLRRPDAVYGTAVTRTAHSRRSLQTVTPLAARLGLDVVEKYGEGDEKALAHELRKGTGTALVAWHHQTLGEIIGHLGRVDPAPPQTWPEERYDVVYVLAGGGHEWRFSQVPQLLLTGDLPDPIGG